MKTYSFAILTTLLVLTASFFACDQHEFASIPTDNPEIVEPTINGETAGQIHNRYCHDGMTFFCENFDGNNAKEANSATYDFLLNQFSEEYSVPTEELDNALAEYGMTTIGMPYESQSLVNTILDSEYGPLWTAFEEGLVEVQTSDELDALLNTLYFEYAETLDLNVLNSFISVTNNSYAYWTANLDNWENCGNESGAPLRGPKIKRVLIADGAGAIIGGVRGGVTGAVLGVGVGAIPGAIGGAIWGATFSSLRSTVTFLFW